MDKYEYKITLDEIKSLVREERFEEAGEISDNIDWNRVKSADTLCMISDIYKINGELEKSRRLLQLANTRQPNTPQILYNLCELNIFLYGRDGLQSDLTNALQLIQIYQAVSPDDPRRLILQYKFYNVSPVSSQEKIAILRQLKEEQYTAKWGYELARLLCESGDTKGAEQECRDILRHFSGQYADMAEDMLSDLLGGSIVGEPEKGPGDDLVQDDEPAYRAEGQEEAAPAADEQPADEKINEKGGETADIPISTPEEQAHSDNLRENVAAGMKDIYAKPYEGIVTQETNGQYAMIMEEPKKSGGSG